MAAAAPYALRPAELSVTLPLYVPLPRLFPEQSYATVPLVSVSRQYPYREGRSDNGGDERLKWQKPHSEAAKGAGTLCRRPSPQAVIPTTVNPTGFPQLTQGLSDSTVSA